MSDTITTLLRTCDTLKARLSGSRPLPIEALRKIEEAFNIEYTYESNRIEGNTLTLQETELVVNKGKCDAQRTYVSLPTHIGEMPNAHRCVFSYILAMDICLSISQTTSDLASA